MNTENISPTEPAPELSAASPDMSEASSMEPAVVGFSISDLAKRLSQQLIESRVVGPK